MNNYFSNPVGSLQERFQSRGITPQYKLVQAQGASHAPTFSVKVILGDLSTTGSGNSKKQAKDTAARAMLGKLDSIVTASVTQTPVLPVEDVDCGNSVGALQEFCVKHGHPFPTYDLGMVGGQPHLMDFSVLCRVGKFRESGAGGTKKDAKRQSAQKMINKLKCLVSNDSEAPRTDMDMPQIAEDMLVTLEVETLNSRYSQEVSNWEIKFPDGLLLMSSLKESKGDYMAMLEELGREQKFVVTCVEVEEKCDDNSTQTQCLLQLSTVPVIVCHVAMTDTKTARNEAARWAINYLQIVTKENFLGEELGESQDEGGNNWDCGQGEN